MEQGFPSFISSMAKIPYGTHVAACGIRQKSATLPVAITAVNSTMTHKEMSSRLFFSPRCGESIHIKHHFFSLQLAAVMGFQQYVYFKSPIPVRRFNMLRSRMTSAPSHITEGTQRVMLRSIRSKELGEHICFSQVTTVESCLGFIYTL